MRDRAAENLPVQHAGHAHIVDIFRAARDLGAGFETRDGAADLIHDSASSNGAGQIDPQHFFLIGGGTMRV